MRIISRARKISTVPATEDPPASRQNISRFFREYSLFSFFFIVFTLLSTKSNMTLRLAACRNEAIFLLYKIYIKFKAGNCKSCVNLTGKAAHSLFFSGLLFRTSLHIDFSHGRRYTYFILMPQGDFMMYLFIFSNPI